MKNMKELLLSLFFTLYMASGIYAASESRDFDLSVTFGESTGINILTFSVTNGSISNSSSSILSFSDLGYFVITDPVTNVVSGGWRSNQSFILDIVPTGGSVSPADITVHYAEMSNPNIVTNGHGLGWKSTITFMTVRDGIETPIAAHGGTGKMLLKDISDTGEAVTAAETANGVLRIHVAMVAQDPSASIPDPAQGELFTTTDQPGEYTGSLTISATIF